LLSVA
jgi:hypothetical protein